MVYPTANLSPKGKVVEVKVKVEVEALTNHQSLTTRTKVEIEAIHSPTTNH